MSPFEIDKLMRHVEESDDRVRSYADDPAGFVSEWERKAREAGRPVGDGGTLTDEARAAFVAKDPVALYRLGAHPYLLWHFAEAVWVWAGGMAWQDVNRRFRAATADIGHPDFST